MPNLYIIAGCNGAGKTTASFTVLPEMLDCDEFINADEIARGLSPLNPERAAIEAGRLMLTKIDKLIARFMQILTSGWILPLKLLWLRKAMLKLSNWQNKTDTVSF